MCKEKNMFFRRLGCINRMGFDRQRTLVIRNELVLIISKSSNKMYANKRFSNKQRVKFSFLDSIEHLPYKPTTGFLVNLKRLARTINSKTCVTTATQK